MSGTKRSEGVLPALPVPVLQEPTEEVDIPNLALRRKVEEEVSGNTAELVQELLEGLRSRKITPDDALGSLQGELLQSRLRVLDLENLIASLRRDIAGLVAAQEAMESENQNLKKENTKLSVRQWDETLKLRREVERLRGGGPKG